MYRKVPIPIVQLELRNVPDETGLTAPEKVALYHAWKLIAPHTGRHAIDQFIEFFSANEQLLDLFRNEEGDIKMMELHMHKHKMFEFLESLILDGIETLPKMHSSINPLSSKHMKCNITMSAYDALSDHLLGYFKKVLKRFLSPCLESALEKVFSALRQSHGEKLKA